MSDRAEASASEGEVNQVAVQDDEDSEDAQETITRLRLRILELETLVKTLRAKLEKMEEIKRRCDVRKRKPSWR